MKLKNDWWGFGDCYGWAVMVDIINEHRDGGEAIFFSFKDNNEFNLPFRDLEDHGITFALRYLKKLPEKERNLAKAEFEACRKAWPDIQVKQIEDKKKEIETQRQQLEALKAQQEQSKLEAELDRQARYVEALAKEQARDEKIKTDRANAAIACLQENGIFNFWHFTSFLNLNQIVKSQRLFARAVNPNPSGVKLLSSEISREQDERLGREHYVRLSFIPNSYYFHAVKSLGVVWLRFSLQLLNTEAVKFVKGNGASPGAHVEDDLTALALDWATMREFQGAYSDEIGPTRYASKHQREGDNQAEFLEEKNIWNSEIMVKSSLPFSYCDGVYDALTGVKLLAP